MDDLAVAPRPAVARNRSLAKRYQDIGLAARADGASQMQLVALLYDELAIALDVLLKSDGQGDAPRAAAQHERAASILHALEAGLDPLRGGALAANLGAIYRQMRRQLAAARAGETAGLADVRAGVAALADAWGKIAP